MALWTNLQWIVRFVNPMQQYITCEKSGGLHLAELGFTAGWLAAQLAGQLADKIWVRLETFKACCRSKYSILCIV